MQNEAQLAEPDAPLPVPSPNAIFKPVAEGGVLFATETEIYFGVNAVGARIWELLPPSSATVGQLCTAIRSRYPDVSAAQIRSDVRDFLDALLENGLAVSSSANAARRPAV